MANANWWRTRSSPRTFTLARPATVFAHRRVIEVDPFSQEVAWVYPEDDEHPLRAVAMGASQRLANGNTLIIESPRGHALEVTRDGQTVWEFWNPERFGEEGELIATLPHLERLPPDLSLDWIE